MVRTLGFCLFDNCLTFKKASAVDKTYFAKGAKGRWFEPSHGFIYVAQLARAMTESFRLLPCFI
jgi:hypothetical protein